MRHAVVRNRGAHSSSTFEDPAWPPSFWGYPGPSGRIHIFVCLLRARDPSSRPTVSHPRRCAPAADRQRRGQEAEPRRGTRSGPQKVPRPSPLDFASKRHCFKTSAGGSEPARTS
eukprot:8906744-Pyramimonas_sp.AAC.1